MQRRHTEEKELAHLPRGRWSAWLDRVLLAHHQPAHGESGLEGGVDLCSGGTRRRKSLIICRGDLVRVGLPATHAYSVGRLPT